MKSKKRIFKYVLRSFFEFIISGILTFFIYINLYYFFYDIYFSLNYPTINSIILNFLRIKNSFFGDSLYFIFAILIFIIIYYLITYKKYKNISLLVENVEEMSNGNLEKRIEIKSKGDIGEVVDNINDIVNQLNNITENERKAQQTKTDLITNVSHDLRTPLTSIIGYLSLIEEDKYKDEVELRYYTNIAYEKSLNLNVLINDLFELTKMQNRTVSLDKIDLNLTELLGQLVSHFDVEFKKENMKCNINFIQEKVMVNCDPIKMVRAFENLITNAIKYGKDGNCIDINLFTEDKMAVVQVINYGESIPIVELPYIFDRFYRVEKSRNRVEGGSGLGLAITKNIIELHEGNIMARSNNEETVFEVKIPYINN